MQLRSRTLFRLVNNISSKKMSNQAGFVRSTAASGSQVYESKRAVDEYLLFHFGTQKDLMPYSFGPVDALDFPERCANICSEAVGTVSNSRALDIGCAVGGSTFQLARNFQEVVGVDFSQHFVDAANEMKSRGSKEYQVLIQGNNFKTSTAEVPAGIDRSRVQFSQGDACSLSPSLGKFDVVLASNLLCRLPKPRKFLSDIPNFIKSGGFLVMVSPFSWLTEYTEPSEWIGGSDGIHSCDAFATFMGEHVKSLQLVNQKDIPFLIREHERKYQYGVSSCTVWRKV